MISLRGVTVRYGDKLAVADVSDEISDGEWLALIGPNGAGKTSLLRACARLLRHEGEIVVGGQALAKLTRRLLAQMVAFVPQQPELPADMTVADYVLLGRTPHIGFFSSETLVDRRICGELLDRLGLASRALAHLATLSGGELQRLVLARALAQQAPVLLLDEPTSALDLGRRMDALELVDQLRREHGLTVVSAMHDLTLAGQFADRLVLLDGGRAVANGAPDRVLTPSVLAAPYGADVHVMTMPDGQLVVVPRRTNPPPPPRHPGGEARFVPRAGAGVGVRARNLPASARMTTMLPDILSRREDDLDLPVLVWRWPTPLRAVASSPHGGGIGVRSWVVNAQVPSSYSRDDPDRHLTDLARSLGLSGRGVGMLTSAEVLEYRFAEEQGVQVLATVGLGHPTLAAAPDVSPAARSAWSMRPEGASNRVGTINIVGVVPERLSDAALVNAVATLTEAKVQALFDAGLEATGTATDAVCILCPDDGEPDAYGGPRSRFGSRLARATHRAVISGART